jgi:hypothetical protein
MQKINRPAPITSVNTEQQNETDAFLANRSIKRRNIKQHQLEEKIINEQTVQAEDEILFTQITDFFTEDSPENILHTTRQAIPDSLLELYDGNLAEALLESGSEFAYISTEEIETLLDATDLTKEKKQKFKDLAENLSGTILGDEEALIDEAAKVICKGNVATIYLMLCYLYEDLSKSKAKKELQERLKKIIDMLERQESAYLFNFFSSKNLLTSNNSPNLTQLNDSMAKISAGTVKLGTLKQTLEFLTTHLNDSELHKMVSLFMKFQAKNFKTMALYADNNENRENIANLLKQERNLILLNSIYNLCKKLFQEFKKVKEINEKYGQFMGQIIGILESSTLNFDYVLNMQKTLGINASNEQPDINRDKFFTKELQKLLTKLPQPIFQSDSGRNKVLDVVKGIIIGIEKYDANLKQPSGLSFIRKKEIKPRVC